MIVRQYYVNAWLSLVQTRLWRVMRAISVSHPAKRHKFDDYWTWKLNDHDDGFTFRFGNHGGGILVEVSCQDVESAIIDDLESKLCGSERFERMEAIVEFAPVSSPKTDPSNGPKAALLPVDIIEPRWASMHPQEQAYATCLFDCVRLEHLMRRHLPADAKMPGGPDKSVVDESVTEADDLNEESGEVEEARMTQPTPKYAMGTVASAFVRHPDHVDLLSGMGMNYNLSKMVTFRNYLIHGVNSQIYTAGKLKKSYEMLQRLLYFLKRWPHLVSLHHSLAVMIDEWHAGTGLHGPPAPPSALLVAQRKGRAEEMTFGLIGEDLAILRLATRMLLEPDPPYSAEEICATVEKIKRLNSIHSQDVLPSA